MNNTAAQNSTAWVSFTYLNMIASTGLTFAGLLFLPIDIWMKGYLLMGVTMIISSTTILTKTLRDVQESSKLHNKIEDAKTEQLLMRIDRGAKA